MINEPKFSKGEHVKVPSQTEKTKIKYIYFRTCSSVSTGYSYIYETVDGSLFTEQQLVDANERVFFVALTETEIRLLTEMCMKVFGNHEETYRGVTDKLHLKFCDVVNPKDSLLHEYFYNQPLHAQKRIK